MIGTAEGFTGNTTHLDDVLFCAFSVDLRFALVTMPVTVYLELVLVLSFRNVQNYHEIAVAFHHRNGFPLGECSTDSDVSASLLPFEDGG